MNFDIKALNKTESEVNYFHKMKLDEMKTPRWVKCFQENYWTLSRVKIRGNLKKRKNSQ